MFKTVKKLKAKLTARKSPVQPSGFDNPAAALPSMTPPPAAVLAGPPRSTEASIRPFALEPPLRLMQIVVQIFHFMKLNEWPQIPLGAIRSFEQQAPDTSGKGYSYDEFLRLLDRELDKDVGRDATEAKYGTLHYFTLGGEPMKIKNQEDFEMAIDHLYFNKREHDVMQFLFQPEHDDQMKERHDAAQVVIDIQAAEAFAEDQREKDRLAKEADDALAADRLDAEELAAQEAAEEAAEAELAEESAISSPKTLPKTPQLAPAPETETESPTPARSQSPVPSTQTPVKQFTRPSRISKHETKKQRYERLLPLFPVEEERKKFSKGGDELPPLIPVAAAAQSAEEDVDFIEEEEADAVISQEDRIATRLQSMLSSETLVQLKASNDPPGSFSKWDECCRMFGHDPASTGIDTQIEIAGLKGPLYQYQAHGVYWQMVNSRAVGGGFVADDPGFGKTLSYLAYIVVERQLAVLWRDVNKSRAAGDKRHLPVGHPDPNAICPNQKPRWIACPCSPGSVTAAMQPQPGLRMACVPSAVVSSWWAEWKKHVDVSNSDLSMRIIIDHAAAFDASATMAEMNTSHANNSRVRSRITSDKYVKKDGKGFDQPKDYQEGYLLLTTLESYPRLAKALAVKGQVQDPKQPGVWTPGNRVPLVFGIAMIDEAHESYFKGKGRGAILDSLPTSNSEVTPFLWGYTGTPVAQTPRGLEGVLSAIEKHSKKDYRLDPSLSQFSWDTLNTICLQYDNQMKSPERDDAAVAQILASFEPFLNRFVIKRTSTTNWFGHPVKRSTKHIHQDIILEANVEIVKKIADFEATFDDDRDQLLITLQEKWDNFPQSRRSNIRPDKLQHNTMVGALWRSRLLADFPALLQIAKQKNLDLCLTLESEEAIKINRLSEVEQRETSYWKYIRSIVETSPKCMWLFKFITDLNNQKDVNDEEEKLIILTAFPQVALILKLFVQKYFPEDAGRIGVITPQMKPKDRQMLIECFLQPKGAKDQPKYKRDIKFLIGTTAAMGKGLGLTRAHNVVLMEPDSFSIEVQAYGRVDRIGQKNPFSYSYRLIDAGSEIEKKIIKRQVNRNETYGRAESTGFLAALDQQLQGLGIQGVLTS